jgi:hypothetical protein
MMRAAAPSPIAKMVANTAANAGVKCDAAGAAPDAGASGARIALAAASPPAPVMAPAPLAAGAVTGVPQPTQNFAPGITGVPHCGQNRILRCYARLRPGGAFVLCAAASVADRLRAATLAAAAPKKKSQPRPAAQPRGARLRSRGRRERIAHRRR